jgi:3-keto-disaccharide hydrolase
MIKAAPILAALLLLASCNNRINTTESHWIKLFNGKDLNDWIVKIFHHDVGENFGNTFRVEDGMIKVRYDKYGDFNDQFGHLYYKVPFSRFHLIVEYRFVGQQQPGAPDYTLLNSGIMFHSEDPRTMPREQNWPISIEMQLLGGLGDGNPRPTGNMCSPGTEIVYQGKQYDGHCLNSSSATYDGDQWVRADLIVIGDSLITHMINGDTVLQYSKPSMGGGVVEGYDSAVWEPGKPLRSGFIALQSEGQPIDFRRVELLNLAKNQ